MSDQSRYVYACIVDVYSDDSFLRQLCILDLKITKEPKQQSRLGTTSNKINGGRVGGRGGGMGLAVPRRLFFFGSLVLLDVVRCY